MDYSDKLAAFNMVHSLMQRVKGKKVLVKYGGAAMKDIKLTEQVIENIILLQNLGLQFIIVHGGGPAINQCLEKLQIKPKFDRGIRITDTATMQVVQMVLAGQVNKNIVSMLNKKHAKAVGLSGHDNNFIRALPINSKVDNRVAEVDHINVDLINLLLCNHYIPVVAPLGVNELGLSYNINADTVAGSIAAELKVDMMIMLTDTPGILEDCNDLNSIYTSLTSQQVAEMIHDGHIFGGMIPKVESCLNALNNGVSIAKIIDGRLPNSLFASLVDDSLVGTTLIS